MSQPLHDRRASYKTPPAAVRDRGASQEVRRKKALEEQKRRRAERFDSTRQLDFFADLNLGPSDDEPDEVVEPVREGIAQYASMLSNPSPAASTSSRATIALPSRTSDVVTMIPESTEGIADGLPTAFGKKKPKSKRKSKGQGSKQAHASTQSQSKKPSKWADKCMYAELLEMSEDLEMTDFDTANNDGIPDDIEGGWVAVTPVPMGKRCLAITHSAAGIAGIVPNTTLRSRVLGKSIMAPFPSPLPPHTIVDCILDENWRDNGILHVLDVLKWKGQDIADCETPFRFWWRDTRLSELAALPPSFSSPKAPEQASSSTSLPQTKFRFRYPTTLVPIPYYANITFQQLASELIPLTRHTRHINIPIPLQQNPSQPSGPGGDMILDESVSVQLHHVPAPVSPDGLLLYVAHASYEPGTSPLSTWVPVRAYTTEKAEGEEGAVHVTSPPTESPLDVFERLIRRRLTSTATDAVMDVF